MKKGKIKLIGMEFYAYHGHFLSEQTVGNTFVVDAVLITDCEQAIESDNLKHALNYQTVYQLIQREMKENSYLLEHIAGRILNTLFHHFNQLIKAKVKVSKINPPIGGKIKNVSVCLSRKI